MGATQGVRVAYCPECGSTNIKHDAGEPALWDCLDCAIWFDPTHPNNEKCFAPLSEAEAT